MKKSFYVFTSISSGEIINELDNQKLYVSFGNAKKAMTEEIKKIHKDNKYYELNDEQIYEKDYTIIYEDENGYFTTYNGYIKELELEEEGE